MTLSTDAMMRITVWALSDDCGVSSKTIARVALGMTTTSRIDFDCPHDAGDFGRCYRLLRLVPELEEFLPAVVEACPQWAPLMLIWSRLMEMYAAGDRDGCGALIREYRDSCREAGGWKRVGEGSWVRTRPLPEGAE